MKNKLLLIIDDEEDILEVIEVKLEELGCQIMTALNAEDGLEIIENHNVSCILCDIVLPKMSGIDLIKACREKNLNYPFIFYSGAEREQYMQDVLQFGAFDFVSKPDLSNLEDSVRRALKSELQIDLKDQLVQFLGVQKKEVADENIQYAFLPKKSILGIPSIDEQHDALFKILDEIEMKIITDDPSLVRSMKRLQLYLKEHLHYEEELFERYSYPDTNVHKDQHVKFLRMCELLQKSMKLDRDERAQVFEKFKEYSLRHFVEYDLKYGDFLRECGVK